MTNFNEFREMVAGVIAPSVIQKRDAALRAANTDALTGLANSRALELATPTAEQERLAFIVFDANNFGLVNKRISYAMGNEVLIGFAGVIGLVAKHYKARAFRMGGDEFVIIAPPAFALAIRDKVERLAKPLDFNGFTVSLSGEVGKTIEDADSRIQARKATHKRTVGIY